MTYSKKKLETQNPVKNPMLHFLTKLEDKEKPDHSYIKEDKKINFFYISIISPFCWTTYLKLYRLLHNFQEVYLLSSCILSHINFFLYKDKVYWQRPKKK